MDNKGFLLRRSELFLGKGTHQTVVGRGSYLYTTTDAWDTYIKQESIGMQLWTGVAISGINPLIQTAVTISGSIYTTQDAWDSFVIQSVRAINARAVAISHSDPLIQTIVMRNDGFSPGYIYTTKDGWKTTKSINVGTLAMLKIAISPTNPLVQTAVSSAALYVTTDGWDTYTTHEGEAWRDVAISPVNPMIQTAVTYGYMSGKIITTTDAWRKYTTRVSTSTVFTGVAISFSSPLIQTAITYGNTTHKVLYVTHNAWDSITEKANLPNGTYWSVAIASDDPMTQSVVDGAYSRVYATLDGWDTPPRVIELEGLAEPSIAIA